MKSRLSAFALAGALLTPLGLAQGASLQDIEQSLEGGTAEIRWRAFLDLKDHGDLGIPQLLEALEHSDAKIRSEAPYRLARFGVAAELALLQAIEAKGAAGSRIMALGLLLLQDESCGQATGTLLASGKMNEEVNLGIATGLELCRGNKSEWVSGGLDHEVKRVRQLCARVVASDEREEANPRLVQLLESDDLVLVFEGARGVTHRGLSGEPWRSLLLAKVKLGNESVRSAAACALVTMGGSLTDALTPISYDSDAPLKGIVEELQPAINESLRAIFLDETVDVETRARAGGFLYSEDAGGVPLAQTTEVAGLLAHKSKELAQVAAFVLQASPELAPEVWPLVVKVVKRKPGELGGRCLMLLGESEVSIKGARSAVKKYISKSTDFDQCRAVKTFGSMGLNSKSEVALFRGLLRSENSLTREYAAAGLGNCSSKFVKSAVSALLAPDLYDSIEGQPVFLAMRHRRSMGDFQVEVFRALAQLGGAGRKAIQSVLEPPYDHPGVWAAIRYGVPESMEDPAPYLRKLLESKSSQVRLHAAEALIVLGKGDADVVKVLTTGQLTIGHLRALATLGPVAASSSSRVIDNLRNLKNPKELVEHLRALGRIGSTDKKVVKVLLANLKKRGDATIHVASLRALADLGDKAGSAVPSIIKACNGRDGATQHAAVRALMTIDPSSKRSLIAVSKMLLDEKRDHCWSEICTSLEALGSQASFAIPTLRKAIQPQSRIRWAACAALAACGSEAAPAIAELAKSIPYRNTPEHSLKMVMAIRSLGPDAAHTLPALLRSARYSVPNRPGGGYGIGSGISKTPRWLNPYDTRWESTGIGPAVEHPGWTDVQVAAIEAIAGIGPHGDLARPTLELLAASKRPRVQEAAKAALVKLGERK